MTIAEAHYAFKMAMDRIDSLATPDFNILEIDWLLNEAQLLLIKTKFNGNNARNRGFENTQKRVDDLASLVIKYPLQPAITPTLISTGVYEVPLSALTYKYLHFVAAKVDAVANDCTYTVNLRFSQHDDYLDALQDPFNKPSLDSLLYNFGRSSSGSGQSMYIYSGTYSVPKVYIEYIKYPQQVSYGNYTYIDGIVYPPTDFELPEQTHQEIIDLACQIAALNIENPEYIQLKNQRAFISE